MSQIKISIIIPVYNVELYIAECLQSVMRQTYQGPMECIVVDDCSTDKSIGIAEQLIAQYDGPIEFRVLHHEYNRGVSAARNTGTDVAIGDYIFYLDSDDYISDDCFDILTAPLRERDYDMVLGDLEMFGNPRDITFLPQKKGPIIGSVNVFSSFYSPRMIYVMPWNKLVKRNLFDQYDLTFLEGQLHEDELWTYKCCCILQSLYVQKDVTYHYRIRENSLQSLNVQKHHYRIRENSITADYNRQQKKRYDSCFRTIDYVLAHPAPVEKKLFDKCVVYYFEVYLRYTFDSNLGYYKDYVCLRDRFDYTPIVLWRKRELSLQDLKHQLHFILSPRLGYCFLCLKRLKHKFN